MNLLAFVVYAFHYTPILPRTYFRRQWRKFSLYHPLLFSSLSTHALFFCFMKIACTLSYRAVKTPHPARSFCYCCCCTSIRTTLSISCTIWLKQFQLSLPTDRLSDSVQIFPMMVFWSDLHRTECWALSFSAWCFRGNNVHGVVALPLRERLSRSNAVREVRRQVRNSCNKCHTLALSLILPVRFFLLRSLLWRYHTLFTFGACL